jgi:hypothetical protein
VAGLGEQGPGQGVVHRQRRAVAVALLQEPPHLGEVVLGVVGNGGFLGQHGQHGLGEVAAAGAVGVGPPGAAFGVDAVQVAVPAQIRPGDGEERPGGRGAGVPQPRAKGYTRRW